jgi:hypothetical protein
VTEASRSERTNTSPVEPDRGEPNGGNEKQPAPDESSSSDVQTKQGFELVKTSVYVVGGLFLAAMIGVVGFTNGDASTISAMLTAVTGVIGSLVGAYFGIQVGNQGRQEVEERAEGRRQGAEDTLNKALAVLPPEEGAMVLGMDMPSGRPQADRE